MPLKLSPIFIGSCVVVAAISFASEPTPMQPVPMAPVPQNAAASPRPATPTQITPARTSSAAPRPSPQMDLVEPPAKLAFRLTNDTTETERSSLLVMPKGSSSVIPDDVLGQLPDPLDAPAIYQRRLEALRAVPRQEARVVRSYESVVKYAIEYLDQLKRTEQVRITLAECIKRALANSYRVRIESYNPAISQAQLVQAEAAFDAEFFFDYSYSDQDRAVANDFEASTSDSRSYNAGVRQLLPTGMQVSTRLVHSRLFSDNQFQTLNPAYTSQWVNELRQPLLRGFGLDITRAQVNIRAAEREAAVERFAQEVRDTLLDVETAYWQLMQARRTTAILAETVAQNRATYESVLNRAGHDATEVEIQNSKSSWDQRVVEYQESLRLVRDAEDRLKNALNDPELLLSQVMEIIPTDTPLLTPLQIDQFAAVRSAIEEREEILQVRKAIDIARINTNVAKNQELPQLDLTFNYTLDGLENSADVSFDRLTTGRFDSYSVAINFSFPIGNRARRAAVHVARLQESQSVARLRQLMDGIVVEVNEAVRRLVVRWTQIPTQLDSVRAAERNLRALQARTQRIDPPYLQTELNAVEQLNNTRNRLLQIVTEYTTAVAQLERAKGTLLEYNNVTVSDVRSGR